jgi:tripartite-type tricarboxylate transporter receptor subunit TctC
MTSDELPAGLSDSHAKTNPGEISFGSSVTGSPLQMAGEMFKIMSGIDMVIVPYRG